MSYGYSTPPRHSIPPSGMPSTQTFLGYQPALTPAGCRPPGPVPTAPPVALWPMGPPLPPAGMVPASTPTAAGPFRFYASAPSPSSYQGGLQPTCPQAHPAAPGVSSSYGPPPPPPAHYDAPPGGAPPHGTSAQVVPPAKKKKKHGCF
mmetsp:Transcript_45441/g.105406  ORF Transcript_45441/g.105406 Transcript_45441/m.105406 type:complete len:148 (+) Transcript_45441:98-541(+)